MEVDPPTCAASTVNTQSASTSNPTAGTSKQLPEETDEFLQTGRVGRRNAGNKMIHILAIDLNKLISIKRIKHSS